MKKLVILSRDAHLYRQHIEKSNVHPVELLWAGAENCPTNILSKAQILLAEPDLAADVLTQCHQLEWLQSTWAGVSPVLSSPAQDFVLTGVKDVFGKQMREFVFAYILHFSRNIGGFQKQQQKALWQPPKVTNLYGKKLGIMGVGSIGKEVAKLAKSFDLTVKGFTHSKRDCPDIDSYYSHDEIEAFCDSLDYLVCLLPDTKSTRHILCKRTLSFLPKYCVLINAGRGQTIDDTALIDALHKNRLKAAVLDVFSLEPLPAEHPFWRMPNVHITQHTAALSLPEDIVKIYSENLSLFLNRQPLKYAVNRQTGY